LQRTLDSALSELSDRREKVGRLLGTGSSQTALAGHSDRLARRFDSVDQRGSVSGPSDDADVEIE
jgi:hypothetical protein